MASTRKSKSTMPPRPAGTGKTGRPPPIPARKGRSSRPPASGTESARPRLSTLGYEERAVERVAVRPPVDRVASSPEIVFGSAPAGRDTLALIASELSSVEQPSGVRPRRVVEAPLITTRVEPAGRETLAAIEAELAEVLAPAPSETAGEPRTIEAEDEIFEMVTFVVRSPDSARLATPSARRQFVEERLLRRLPITSMADVDRVDVTPWTVRGTVIVRVWCRLEPLSAG